MISERTFTFPIEDRQWGSKFIVGSLLTLVSYIIPIIPLLFVWGYTVRLMRDVIETKDAGLPKWDDWADLGTKGIYYFIVQFIYLLPGLALLLGSVALFTAGILLSKSTLPQEAFWKYDYWVPYIGVFMIYASIVSFIVSLIVIFAGFLTAPIGIARFAAGDDLGAALEIGRVLQIIRRQFGPFVLAWAVVYGLGVLLSTVLGALYYTVCFCVLIPFVSAPLSFFHLLFRMRLFAQVCQQGEAAVDLMPPPTSPGAPTPAAEASQAEATITPSRPAEDAPLQELGLPMRMETVLIEGGFTTVGEVLKAVRANGTRLLALKGFGSKSLEVLKDRLRVKGYVV